ncbi:MAG: hypothetical protein ACLSAC_07465 [Enterocloster bolteae]
MDDDVSGILKVSEGRWQAEECFRIMKTDFSARPIYLQEENRITGPFPYLLSCPAFLSRFWKSWLGYRYTCEEILNTLRALNFAEIQEQGFVPLYERERITDELHNVCGFHTDYEFLTKEPNENNPEKSREGNKLLYFKTYQKTAVMPIFQRATAVFLSV